MPDDLSLLLRIRGDAAGAKAAVAESRAAVASLRSSFSSELNQMQAVSKTALGGIADNLNVFVGQRIPLVGGAFVRVTENIKGLSSESKKVDQDIAKFTQTVGNLATNTGKTSSEITKFLTGFVQLETQAQRDAAAIEKFGAAAAQTLIPQLEKAGTELAAVATSTEAAAAGAGGLVAALGPIGIAAIGIAVELAAVAIGFGLVVKAAESLGGALFDLGKTAADFRGKLVDLSQQTGISVETLSALEVVAKTTGSEIGSITASLGIFQRKLEEAQDPTTKIAGLFRELGVDAETTEGALRQTLAAIAAMPEGFAQTAKALELFGRGGKAFLAIAKEANGDIDATIKKLRELGLIVSTEDAVAADKFNDQLALLQFQFRALLGNDVIPAATKALEDISKVLKDNREAINFVGKAIGLLSDGIGNIVKGALRNLQIGIDILNAKWQEASIAVELLKPKLNEIKAIYEGIALAAGFIAGHPLPKAPAPEVGLDVSAPLFEGSQSEKQIKLRIQALKELTGFQSAAAEDAKRIGQLAIDEADRQFTHGKINREQQLKQTLFGLQQIRDAELNGIEQTRRLKLDEFNLAQKQGDDATSVINDLAALDGKKRAVQDKFIADTKDAQAKAQADERSATEQHNEALLKIYLDGAKTRISAIEDERDSGKTIRENAMLQLDAIEAEQLRRRQENLQKQLELPQIELGLRKKINEELATVSKNLADVERGQIESLLQAATKAALEAEKQISALRDVDFKKRETALTGEKEKTADPNERQKIDDQLKALDVERTESEKQQAIRRKQIAQDEADTRTAILFGNTSEIQRIGAVSDAARIADLETLASARLGIEKNTAEVIAQIHRNAETRDAAISKAETLRRRQDELKQTLESGSLELEARTKINAELDAIAKSLVAGEQQQLDDLKASVAIALSAEIQIQALQETGFRRRESALSKEKTQTTDPAELEKINDKLKALDFERSEAQKEQSERRKQIVQDEADLYLAITSSNAEEVKRINASSDAERIVSLKALTSARVKGEEDITRSISQIQREAEERDIAISKSSQLRRRQEELKLKLEDSALELNARKKLTADLDSVSSTLITGERHQIDALVAASRTALDVESQIASLQDVGLRKRQTALAAEKLRTTDPAELERINDQLRALDVERTEAEKQQAIKRGQIADEGALSRVAILSGNAEEVRRIGEASDADRISSLKILSAALVATEEDTTQAIAQIHRDAEARDAAIAKASKLRQREEELKETLAGANLEREAREKISIELASIAGSLVVGEQKQIQDLQIATKIALDAAVEIAALQEELFRKRGAALVEEKQKTTDPAELKRINDQLRALDAERSEAERVQSSRRKDIIQNEADTRAAIVSGNTSEIQRLEATGDELRVASLRALGTLRVSTEEDTAREIDQIHRDAEARDSAATKASQLRQRQEELRNTLEGTQIELNARQRLNAELQKVSTERANRERSQIEDLLKTATDAALEAEARLKALQDTALTKRKADLTGEKLHTTDPAEIKRLNDQIAALDATRTANEKQQSARRAQVTQDEADLRAQIVSGSLSTIQEIAVASDKVRIASQQALADAGIQSAEDTARAIAEIQRDADIREGELRRTERLRQREEEIKQILQGANLEVEARKSVNAELAQISRELAEVEKRQVEDLVKARTASALKAETDIKKIEDDALAAREAALRKKLSDPIDVVARQAVIDQLKALGQEAAENERQHELRVTQIHKDEAQTRLEIAKAIADAELQIADVKDAQAIAKIKAFVLLRVQTEEQAEKDILAIKLAAVNREIEALRIEQAKSGAIADPDAQAKQRADLNNQLKVFIAQRVVLQEQGNRDIEEGRLKDLENERRYSEELISIRQKTVEAQRETQQLAVNLLVLKGAPQAQIIAAQLKLELDNLKTRHDAVQRSIDKDKSDTDARIATLTKLTDALAAAGQKDSDVYKQAVIELAKANETKIALHIEEEAELERHEKEKELIRIRAAQAERDASPTGRIGLNIDDLREFARIVEDSIVPLNEILVQSFNRVADAIGQTVKSWVLLGTTGPAVMRKILAEALASIAAEAAINAIKEAAIGFATLFFNPAESASHFIASGLWASIAGVAAIAGRGVAGDLFKQPASASGGGGGTATKSTEAPKPVDIGRNRFATTPQAPSAEPIVVQPQIHITMTGQATEGFKYMVEKVNIESFRENGVMRRIQNGDNV